MNIIAPNAEARAIIERALSPSGYAEMAHKEATIWGRVAIDPQRQEITRQEQEAAGIIGLNEGRFSFMSWCRRNKRTFDRGLSIGCGGGRAERSFAEFGICKSFHGVDIAPDAIEEARRQAPTFSYEVADINFVDFGSEQYDLIIAQTSLHHLVHLEDVFAAIHKALVPGGIFWMLDYIGESQFQYSDDRLSIVNDVLEKLPEPFRYNRLTGRTIGLITRPTPGRIASPFESIRSGEILQIAKGALEFVDGYASSSILHLAIPMGTRSAYAENETGIALAHLIRRYDESLINAGTLEGTDGRYVFRRPMA